MFTILAHGIQNARDNLSYAQDQLLNSGAPIRVCGAPTGAGKTHAFFEAVRRGQLVFFVVPTQALAEDIQQSGAEQGLAVEVWDYNQTRACVDKGQAPWVERDIRFKELKRSGGMIVATVEALAKLVVGITPKAQYATLDIKQLLQQLDHLVFDEAHTLNERAYGLVHLLMILVADLHQQNPAAGWLKLSLLSATHGNLFAKLIEPGLLPDGSVHCFDERIADKDYDRAIHGDVQVEFHDAPLLDTAQTLLPALLAEAEAGDALLLIYDALARFAQDEAELARLFAAHGIKPEQVILINGQDKQSRLSWGSSGFDGGRLPLPRHKIIIGTSAVEMGVNFKVKRALIEHGLDAAALLQRIGRVARGARHGQVHVCRSSVKSKTGRGVADKLEALSRNGAALHIEQVRDHFRDRKGHLKKLDLAAAQWLGGAYWSMLSRANPYLVKDAALPALRDLTGNDNNPAGYLNRLHRIAREQDWRNRRHFQAWLKAVDKALQDVRGFTPNLRVSFNGNVGEYSADWVLSRLDINRARYDEADDVWVFNGSRDDYLYERAQQIPFSLLSPCCPGVTLHARHLDDARGQFLDWLENKRPAYGHDPGFEDALKFMQITRLLVRDEGVATAESRQASAAI